MKQMMKQTIQRFQYTFQGCRWMLNKDSKFLQHIIMAVGVVILNIFLGINSIQFALTMTAVFLVIITEVMNTSIEYVVDLVTDKYHDLAMKAKDVAAFGVLLAAIYALIIAAIVYLPYMM